MKNPSRMRTMDRGTKNISSAYEVNSVSPEVFGSSYRSRQQLVSKKYSNRRRNVNFKIPESELWNPGGTFTQYSSLADKGNKNNYHSSLGSNNDIFGIREDDDDVEYEEFNYTGPRRMSAPELPPISGKSTLVSNGYLSARSNTFFNSKPDRKSIHSDSSIQGYRLNSQSRTSSSSSQKSRGRVLSAGTGGRKQTLTAELPKSTNQAPTSTQKQTFSGMRNGASTAVSQRCQSSSGVISRAKTKMSFKDASTPRSSIHHSKSEAQINTRMRSNNSEVNMRRINSERSLADARNNNNTKNSQNNKTTNNKRNSNMNGIRRYASTNGLNSKDERKSDDSAEKDGYYDSDSDTEKDQRVLQWIIGVTEIAEPPEEAHIEHTDEPPQRDTAIRIVYDGDS